MPRIEIGAGRLSTLGQCQIEVLRSLVSSKLRLFRAVGGMDFQQDLLSDAVLTLSLRPSKWARPGVVQLPSWPNSGAGRLNKKRSLC